MLGIIIRLGASKDQIENAATGEVLVDRYAARNAVKLVPTYEGKHKNADGSPHKGRQSGQHYQSDSNYNVIDTARKMILDKFKTLAGQRRYKMPRDA
jgi:hypothetical protein